MIKSRIRPNRSLRYVPVRPMDSTEDVFLRPIDRKAAIHPDIRRQLTAQNRSMARSLALASCALHTFADTLSALDPERPGTLSLRANVLMLTQDQMKHTGLPRALPHPDAIDLSVLRDMTHPGCLEALTAPITLGTILEPAAFERLSEARLNLGRYLPRVRDDLTRLTHLAHPTTLGVFSSQVRRVAHALCGLEPAPETKTIDLPVAA